MIHFHHVIRQLEAGQIGAGLSDLPDHWMKYLHVSDQEPVIAQVPAEAITVVQNDRD